MGPRWSWRRACIRSISGAVKQATASIAFCSLATAVLCPAARGPERAAKARRWGFIDESDPVHLDSDRLLAPAVERARNLLAQGWEPPEALAITVAGPDRLARIEEGLARSAAEGDLLEHDVVVGRALAGVLCGGGEAGPLSESRLLELEREAFLILCRTPATQARIEHMLRTGKPLHN